MKICFAQQYHLSERMGGAEVQSWLLAAELARRGHEVSYVCESLGDAAWTRERREGVDIHWLARQPRFDLLGAPSYYRALRRIRPDVVVQRFTSGYTLVAGVYSRRAGVPFVWICTDDGVPFRRAFRDLQARMTAVYPGSLLRREALRFIAWSRDMAKNRGIALATHPCTQNAYQRNALMREFGIASAGFHSGHPLPVDEPCKDERPLVLWVGDSSHKKRPELFVELADACADLDVDFAMICKNPSSRYRDRTAPFESCAARHPRFTWLGERTLGETNAWFSRASLYVNTSAPDGDGFPNTYVQAWLRGTPVLSFGIDPDGVVSRRGLWRVVGSVAEGRDAVHQFVSMPGREILAERVRDYARSHHTVESVADHFLSLLRPDAGEGVAGLSGYAY